MSAACILRYLPFRILFFVCPSLIALIQRFVTLDLRLAPARKHRRFFRRRQIVRVDCTRASPRHCCTQGRTDAFAAVTTQLAHCTSATRMLCYSSMSRTGHDHFNLASTRGPYFMYLSAHAMSASHNVARRLHARYFLPSPGVIQRLSLCFRSAGGLFQDFTERSTSLRYQKRRALHTPEGRTFLRHRVRPSNTSDHRGRPAATSAAARAEAHPS